MHVVVRKGTNGAALADALQQREQEVRGLIQGVPGFVAYYATRAGDTLTTISVYQTRESTRESTRLAREWVQQNLPGAQIGAPEVTEGETFLQF